MKIELGLLFALCFLISIAYGGDDTPNGTASGLFIEHTYQEITGSQVIYNITIKNSGDIRIRDISVTETLPANMAYGRSSYLFPKYGVLGEPQQIENADGTTLIWSIGDLVSDQSKTIQLMVTYSGAPGGASRSTVIASGSALGTSIVTLAREAQADIGPLG
jgi:uncharacterized repeat protein (TIGR01451 family)